MPATHAPHDRRGDVVDQGATSEALGFWGGGLLALAVTLAGSVPGLVLLAHGGGLAGFYAGLAGILASGTAGIVIAHRSPPVDLAPVRSAGDLRRHRCRTARVTSPGPGADPSGRYR